MLNNSDLAIESRELVTDTEGLEEEEHSVGEITVKKLKIVTESASKRIGRDRGNYITISIADLSLSFKDSAKAICEELKKLLPNEPKTILVAGIGNRNVTPDSLGPRVCDRIFATRHIDSSILEKLNIKNIGSVAVISPGVLGQTGIETAEIIKSLAHTISASAVILIDALTAASVTRLCNTVQLCDAGINPGAGVGNKRGEISEKTLGIPTVAIGVPTVVAAATLIAESVGEKATTTPEMIVTPKDIDSVTDLLAKIISNGINSAIHKTLSAEEIEDIIA